jgi:hypothetical protein
MLKSTERRVAKDPKLGEIYQQQIQDIMEQGAARKLTRKEMDSYEGPVLYISHHEVLNPESESTPCRFVFNTSAKFNKCVLNYFWAKGPDLINNLLRVLL